ncbi:MAG TPA: hypothetical protein VEX37_05220 [Thermomicrobiales bacterium]|nr:hypothetical protein [Thermomicrobiales bacterium]
MDHEQHADGDAMVTNPLTTATTLVELQQDIERIDALCQLPDTWDTYGGVPVTERSAASASALLRWLASDSRQPEYALVRPYGITPLASGGLQLDWRGSHGELTIEVYPDGRRGSYAVESRDGETIERDEEEPSMASISVSLHAVLGIHQPE